MNIDIPNVQRKLFSFQGTRHPSWKNFPHLERDLFPYWKRICHDEDEICGIEARGGEIRAQPEARSWQVRIRFHRKNGDLRILGFS